MEKLVGSEAWNIEDYLQFFESSTGRPVFCSGFDDKKLAHPDSYLTCLNYREFLEAWDNAVEKKLWTMSEWLDTCQYWQSTSSGRPLQIIAIFLKAEIPKLESPN